MQTASTRARATLAVADWAASAADDEHADFAPASGLARRCVALVVRARGVPELVLWLVCRILVPHLAASEITDGNVNFSFCVRTTAGGKALFLKAAEPFLKWQPLMALERERMAREMQYFADARAAIGAELADKHLPRVLHFDRERTFVIMDYLHEHRVLFDELFDVGTMPAAAAVGLGTYLGTLHARTMGRQPGEPAAAAAQRAVDYWNPALRSVQLEHVFSACFERSEHGRELAAEPRLMAEVALLRAKHLGCDA